MLSNRLKQATKRVISSVIARFATQGRRIVVLCYHSIHPSRSFASASPELFSTHLQWLKENTDIVPFTQIPEIASKQSELSRPVVAITFDDGYRDNYEYAFPLLQRYKIPATFFVTVGLLVNDRKVVERFLYLRNCEPWEIEPLSWEQVREMHRTGMEIGVHTYSHPNLAHLSVDEAKSELQIAKEILEAQLGSEVATLAYPFGKYRRHFTDETVRIAKDLGFRYGAAVAFRSVRASDSPLAIPRLFVTRDTVETLAQKVYGGWDWLGWWQEKAPLWLARFVSRKDFEV
ncbi:MAG: polysaccharide deacetylase family protein [Candidatus Methanomethylicaceae archaeon]